MFSPTIMVIAADAGLRQSLVFSLEVEGYRVEAYDCWGGWSSEDKPSFCLIVDADSLRDCPSLLDHIRSKGHSAILLADGISPSPNNLNAGVLTKPFAGGDLLSLVKRIRCHA